MKKSVTYFNFGFLITGLVVVIQIILFLILKIFNCHGPDWLTLCVPPVLAIISGFIWYNQERVLLKIEQYLIAIMPTLYFFSSGLIYVLNDYFQLVVFNVLVAVFMTTWIAQQWAIRSLAGSFNEINFFSRLQLKSFFYLLTCSSAIWFFAYWLFL